MTQRTSMHGLWPFAVAVALAACAPEASTAQQDIDGSADHPLISRFEGARIVGYDRRAFDRYGLALGRALDVETLAESLEIEGAVTRILYLAPAERGSLEVFRNYERALAAAGFETLFHCTGNGCGRLFKYVQPTGSELVPYAFKGFSREWEYMAARGQGPDGPVYVALHTAIHESPLSWMAGRAMTRLDIIEVEAMDEGMVVVDADAMRADIETSGRSVLYDIQFETDRSELLAESDAVLTEIAELLERNPRLALLVVGHTDDQGAMGYNLDLSARRAAAVADALVARYGIEAARLAAHGVGPLAPVAANGTEAGRTLNRRVELVPVR